jgi:hypothetical protein
MVNHQPTASALTLSPAEVAAAVRFVARNRFWGMEAVLWAVCHSPGLIRTCLTTPPAPHAYAEIARLDGIVGLILLTSSEGLILLLRGEAALADMVDDVRPQLRSLAIAGNDAQRAQARLRICQALCPKSSAAEYVPVDAELQQVVERGRQILDRLDADESSVLAAILSAWESLYLSPPACNSVPRPLGGSWKRVTSVTRLDGAALPSD